jgi:serine/threonine protein phosphatase 1
MNYAISDIHGEYDQFMQLLEKIRFSDNDTLYVIGDTIDRGPQPIKVLQFMMSQPNIIPIVGNHELMAITNLRLLMKEITGEMLDSLSVSDYGLLTDWMFNGCESTLSDFRKLGNDERLDIMDYLEDFSTYEEVSAGGKNYLLVHAGLGNFSREKPLEDYTIDDLVWERPDYSKRYFDDIYVVTGHTPTQLIDANPKPGYIYRNENHIAIDCGAFIEGGRLSAICLDTGEEYYSR